MSASLRIENLHAAYGTVKVIHGISMEVGRGESVVLLGTNGNGKSTVMKCILGAVRPQAGRIIATIDGVEHDLAGMATEQIVDLGIVMVPEGRRLFPMLSIEDNLLLGASRQAARKSISRNLEFCYDAFPKLKERRHQAAGSLSGGEQQMVALGRAVMQSPKMVIIDEPSVGLSPLFVGRTMEAILRLRKEFGLTVLMAEQNFHQAVRIADKGYVIVHGEIALEASSQRELRDSEIIRDLYFG